MIVAREVGVTVLRVLVVRRSGVVIAANWWGKAKTVSQVVAVSLFLAPSVSDDIRLGTLYVAIALTLWSGTNYAFKAGRIEQFVLDDAGPGASTPDAEEP